MQSIPKHKPSYNPYKGLKTGGKVRIFAEVESRRKAYKMYYKDYNSYEEIGNYFNTSKVVVKNLFKVMGWPARDRSTRNNRDQRRSEKAFNSYVERYLAGEGIWAIAQSVKVNPVFISKHIKQLGLFRDRSLIAKNNVEVSFASLRAKQRILQANSPYNGVWSKNEFRQAIDYLTRRIVLTFLGPPPKFKWADVGDLKPQIDHRYSIADAYYLPGKRHITPKELCHPVNLRWVSFCENITKGRHSSISLSALRKEIKIYNKIHGDPFETVKVRSACELYH